MDKGSSVALSLPERTDMSSFRCYKDYVRLLTSHEKNVQLAMLEAEFKENVDTLLPLTKSCLPRVTEHLYSLLGWGYSAKNYSDVTHNTVLHFAHASTPLITYIDTYFNHERCYIVRDNLTLYMLIRLVETFILLTHPSKEEASQIICGHGTLHHPFINEKSVQDEGYSRELEKRYDLDLRAIRKAFIYGDDNDFLFHIIFVTCLTAIDYYPHYYSRFSVDTQKPEDWFWRRDEYSHMGINIYGQIVPYLTRYHRAQNPLHLPNEFGYSLDIYLRRIGRDPSKSRYRTKLRLEYFNISAFPIFKMYTISFMQTFFKELRAVHKFREEVMESYRIFLKADGIGLWRQKSHSVQIASVESVWWLRDLKEEGTPWYVGPDLAYVKLSDRRVARDIILERRVSSLVALLSQDLPDLYTYFSLHTFTSDTFTFDDENSLQIDANYSYVGCNSNDTWVSDRDAALEVVSNDYFFALRCMVIIALGLTLNECTEETPLGSFLVNKTRNALVYFPSTKRPISHVRDPYRDFLIGSSRYPLRNRIHPLSFLWDMELMKKVYRGYIWKMGNSFTANICSLFLGLIRANIKMMYDLVKSTHERILYGQPLEEREEFERRVNGLYQAALELKKSLVNDEILGNKNTQ